MTEFEIVSDEQAVDLQRQWDEDAAREAERQRLLDACKAEHGEHDWWLSLELDDEVGGPVDLHCTRCPAGVDDVYPDGHDLIYLEVDGELLVVNGRHHSPVPLSVPVEVDVWSGSYWTDYGLEYEAELQISQRGPSRPVDDPPAGAA